jgi:outer membrane protein assembly factor BamD
MMHNSSLRLLAIALSAILLAGCSSMGSMFSSAEKKVEDRPADVLYKEADTLLSKGEYTKAAETFEEVDRQHPYAPEAKKAMLMAAFSYQKAGKLPEAVAAARRYITLHPGTKEAALAQNIVASSYYERISNPTRDQGETKKAITELETLVQRYPDSRYAEDAKRRLKLSKDMIAASEMNVGRYYQKKGNYLAAINRFKTVVTDYQQTSHVEEALMRLTECYMALGIVNEAETAAAVLGHNFPESRWYKDSYDLLKSGGTAPREDTGSWISRSWRSAVRSVSGSNAPRS